MVHQLGVPDPSMPHVKSLYPPTCPVTRVVMGAGPQQRGRGSVTGLGLCAGKGRCRHLPAVARRGLERRPRKRAGKRRAHARKHEKLGGWASYGLRQCDARAYHTRNNTRARSGFPHEESRWVASSDTAVVECRPLSRVIKPSQAKVLEVTCRPGSKKPN